MSRKVEGVRCAQNIYVHVHIYLQSMYIRTQSSYLEQQKIKSFLDMFKNDRNLFVFLSLTFDQSFAV